MRSVALGSPCAPPAFGPRFATRAASSPGDPIAILFLKLLCWASVCFGLAIGVALKATVAMRAGQRYRFGFLDGGVLLQGKETAPWVMMVAAAVYAVGVSALLAWPLGLYELIADAGSECREIVTAEEVRRLGGEGFTRERAQELGTMCSFEVSDSEYARFAIAVDGYATADTRGATETRVDGARVWRAERGAVRTLTLQGREHGSMTVTLPSAHFDDAAIDEVARLMVQRRDVVDRYASAAHEPPSAIGRSLRRYAPYLFLGLVVFAIAGGVVLVRVRRRRAMQRVLDEEP